MVAKRHTHFQSACHTHSVLSVKQIRHKPIYIQIRNFTSAFFLIIIAVKNRHFRNTFFISHTRIIVYIQSFTNTVKQNIISYRQIIAPWETVCFKRFLLPKPWITAEYFVRTFAGKHNCMIFLHLTTEIQQ